MKLLHLHPDFKPFSDKYAEAGHVELIDYPSGCEPHVRVHLKEHQNESILITARIHNSDDFIRTALAADALMGLSIQSRIEVFIPYMPHARQDRRAVPGDAFSSQVLLSMLGGMNHNFIHVFDVHNPDAYPPRVDVRSHSSVPFTNMVLHAEDRVNVRREVMLVVPDKGAMKRLYVNMDLPDTELRAEARYTTSMLQLPMLVVDKQRDPVNGKLQITVPQRDVLNRTCIILDDICDGGGTFIPIAKELKLRGAARVVLAVSHGLFTKGVQLLFEGGIDHIYTTNSFQDLASGDRLTQFTDWSQLTPNL